MTESFDLFLGYNNDDNSRKFEIIRNIFKLGWECPTIVQSNVIPKILGDFSDIIFQAPSGQGKTGAFLIPLIWKMPENYTGIYAVILLPTRELAQQVFNVANSLTENTDIELLHFIGKIPDKDNSIEMIKRRNKPLILIGTLGKLHKLSNNYKIVTDYFVVDEADNFFTGKEDSIIEIMSLFSNITDNLTHVIFSSATYSDSVKKFIEHETGNNKLFHNDAVIIYKDNEEITLDGINQRYILVNYSNHIYSKIMEYKAEDLISVINDFCVTKSVIFVNTINNAMIVHRTLTNNEFSSAVIHGEMDQSKRTEIINKFKRNQINYLIATDLIARGIDITDISHVFNLEIPKSAETYIHRIGRSGRHGRVGTAISIVTDNDLELLQKYCENYSAKLEALCEPDI